MRTIKTCLVALCFALVSGCNWVIFNPKGQIALEQRNLIILATALMLIVVIPVIVMTFLFAWQYRSTNKKARYSPRWASSHKIEAVVWGVPLVIIIILGWVTWVTTHELDPYRPIESDNPPINVQVIAMDWKWLFIYPDLGIATVNELAMPVHTPVSFTVTSDAAMNSFFIPALGGQIYAMAGMQTRLHLIANEVGQYRGISANYSGPGFSDMHFSTLATTPADFEAWVTKVRNTSRTLDPATYKTLATPTHGYDITYYSAVDQQLFKTIVDKYEGMNKSRRTIPEPVASEDADDRNSTQKER
ncbi:ubiquinol oxidase subunit II [Pseudomonas viridiflava]|uniref:ubiquinol oxidase subunit II n=1 Tax=Pseudomonas viridiflava TaxID=33069 RepID=UPI000F01D4BE|nr:ubiquinol oxidase subunit II [Pseudomonas viridiflava]